MSSINQDFEKVAEQINAKLKEAVAALKEVNRLKSEAGLRSLIVSSYACEDLRSQLWSAAQDQEFETVNEDILEEEIEEKVDQFREKMELIDVSELERELMEGGWSTSSSYC